MLVAGEAAVPPGPGGGLASHCRAVIKAERCCPALATAETLEDTTSQPFEGCWKAAQTAGAPIQPQERRKHRLQQVDVASDRASAFHLGLPLQSY